VTVNHLVVGSIPTQAARKGNFKAERPLGWLGL
jgi:hypothetical protein